MPPLSAIPPLIKLHMVPFCTLKPSWYLRLGRLISTVVVGGHCTIVNLTATSDFMLLSLAWTFARVNPTTLVPSMASNWSPTFNRPDLAAGPVGLKLAITNVGTTEPQPEKRN